MMDNVIYLDDWKKMEMNKFKLKIPKKFGSIENFLEYCVSHSKTSEPFFDISDANLLYETAGRPQLNVFGRSKRVPIYEAEMNELLKMISKKINPARIDGRE